MRIQLSVPGPAEMIRIGALGGNQDDAFIPLRIALRALTDINVWILRRMILPGIYNGRIKYVPERTGHEDWLTVEDIHRLGYGDCEDLACARTAEHIVNGVNAEVDLKSKWTHGILLIHIFVRLPDGSIEDPSAKLGMKGSY